VVIHILVVRISAGLRLPPPIYFGFSSSFVGTSFAVIAVGIILSHLALLVLVPAASSQIMVAKFGTSEELPPEYPLIPAFSVPFALSISLF
jgi:hypothetical protein